MTRAIACTSRLVSDHDEAIDFLTRVLRRELRQGTAESPARHRAVASPGQGGGRVWLRLVKDDCNDDIPHMTAHIVRLAGRPLDDDDEGLVFASPDRLDKRQYPIEPRCR